MNGFETTVAATVEEALKQITSRSFDVLISDLNIGQPGDGLTVVSAMRRVQPKCHTFIPTGFPALDSALKAIRAQVDDYLVKPANIPSLVATIKSRLEHPRDQGRIEGKRLSANLRESEHQIIAKALANMKSDPRLAALPLSDNERIDHIPAMIQELATMLDSENPDQTSSETMQSARKRGATRLQQRYSVDMLVTESRVSFVRLTRSFKTIYLP